MGRICRRWHLLFRFQSFARVTFFLRRFVDFLSDSFFPFLLSLAIMVSPAFCWVIAAAGRRNGFINRSFTSTTLYSFTGSEDKDRGQRMMLLEMLVTRGTSQKSSWRTGKLLWRLWKTICEEPVRFSAQYVCCKSFSIHAASSALKQFIDDLSGFWRWVLENEGKSQGRDGSHHWTLNWLWTR